MNWNRLDAIYDCPFEMHELVTKRIRKRKKSQILFDLMRQPWYDSNLLQKTSSNWVRYDKYEWKEDTEGILYITPAPDAKVSLYNPLKDSEQMVLKAVNLGLMCMDKNNTQEHLQKNHFIKKESMTTEKYLSYFFPFNKIDFVKKGMESSWNTDDVQMMFSFVLTDEKSTLRVCKHCGNAFIASRPNSVFCSSRCKNRYNVYKSRAKDKNGIN